MCDLLEDSPQGFYFYQVQEWESSILWNDLQKSVRKRKEKMKEVKSRVYSLYLLREQRQEYPWVSAFACSSVPRFWAEGQQEGD